MELTTQQIYALFAILACGALFIGIAYCAGLKTGRRSADQLIDKLERHNRALNRTLDARSEAQANTLQKLTTKDHEIHTLRRNIAQETADHQATERALRDELAEARAYALTHDDQQTLTKAVRQLGVAAQQFARSGSTKTNQAAIHRDALSALAAKVQTALDGGHVHPDTALIDWLYANSSANHNELTCYLSFDFTAEPDCPTDLRSILLLARKQHLEYAGEGRTLGFDLEAVA